MKSKFIVIFALLATLVGCDETPTADSQQQNAQEQIELRAVQAVGMPAITRFAEKRMMKDILEMRDKMVPTVTYIVDLNGNKHKLCNSVGFGLPYATQFTNPQKIAYARSQTGVAILPHADPNGLFSPGGADGTWIECINPETGKPSPLYVEPRVIVSPFPLS